jgi:hypothetical protein
MPLVISRFGYRTDKYTNFYFRFITTPGLKPMNTMAEQVLRFVVRGYHVMQKTRSERMQ